MRATILFALVCAASAYQNIVFGNFGASQKMVKRLGDLHEDCVVFESDIKAFTTVSGWQLKWDEYYAMEVPDAIDTVHCLSGGLMSLMLFLDANPHIACDRVVLESPVYPSADMMVTFAGTSVGKTAYLCEWERGVRDSHHYFTDKVVKPFTEQKLDEVSFVINDLLTTRFSEMIVLTTEPDALIDENKIRTLMSIAKRRQVERRWVSVKGKHALFSVTKPSAFKAMIKLTNASLL